MLKINIDEVEANDNDWDNGYENDDKYEAKKKTLKM